MAQVKIRELDDVVVDRLKRRARRHGRSLEEELRLIVSAAVLPDVEGFLAAAAALRAACPPQPAEALSEVLLREDRDR